MEEVLVQEASIQNKVKKTQKRPKVSLVADFDEKLESALKSTGSEVFFLSDLNDFWSDCNKKAPKLLFIHVKKMSHGNRALKDHPLIQQNKIPVVFIYENSTAPLLFSTYGLFSLGYLNLDLDKIGQLKAILNRFNQLLRKDKEIQSLKKAELQMGQKVQKIFTAKEKGEKQKSSFDHLFEVIKDLPTYENLTNFDQALEKLLSKWEIIDTFGIYTLNATGQKLICPTLNSKKYRKLPSLWLGQKAIDGIEFFAQNMASQVAIEIVGVNIITLKILGGREYPDRLVFLKVLDQEAFLGLDWLVLEAFLSGLFSRYELKNHTRFTSTDLVIQPWDFLTKLDAQKWDVETAERLSVIDLNFHALFKLVVEMPKVKFFWGEFLNEFILKFQNICNIDFQTSSVQLGHISFLVDQDLGGDFFDEIKKFSTQFPYWKFFEDYDLVLPKDIEPNVKMVPSSPAAYYKFIKESDNEI